MSHAVENCLYKVGRNRRPIALAFAFFCSFSLISGDCLFDLGDSSGLKRGQSSQQFVFPIDPSPRTESMLQEHIQGALENPENIQLLWELGMDYLELASPARWEYLDQASGFFQRLAQRLPDHPFVKMYMGRCLGAQALNMAPPVYKRLKWAKAGFKYMDQAVALDPDCAFLRLLRGEAALMAHPFLMRGSKLDEDAAFVTRLVSTSAFDRLPEYQKARVHLFLGDYLNKKKQAPEEIHQHWSKAIEYAHDTAIASSARQRLEGKFTSLGYNEG